MSSHGGTDKLVPEKNATDENNKRLSIYWLGKAEKVAFEQTQFLRQKKLSIWFFFSSDTYFERCDYFFLSLFLSFDSGLVTLAALG